MIIKMYGKNKKRTNYIYERAIDKNSTFIIDFSKELDDLYNLVNLKTLSGILLNTDITTTVYYLDLIQENIIENVDEVIINNYEEMIEKEYSDEIIKIIDLIGKTTKIILLFSKKEEDAKKINTKKIKNIEKKILKLNKKVDLDMDARKKTVSLIGDRVI